MKKQTAEFWPHGSAEHVISHGTWQKSRGRNPSLPYDYIKNPREAFRQAKFDLATLGVTVEMLNEQSQACPSISGFDRVFYKMGREAEVADRTYAIARRNRNQTIVLATEIGHTRRQIGEIIDLTPGRVQQIVDASKPQA